jgi:hypothetical protein
LLAFPQRRHSNRISPPESTPRYSAFFSTFTLYKKTRGAAPSFLFARASLCGRNDA